MLKRTILPISRKIDIRFRLIAPVLLVLAVTAGAFVLLRDDAGRDADRDAENRAAIAAAEVRNGIEQASNLVESLRRFMIGPSTPGVSNAEFADVGGRWLTPVGLPAAAWLQAAPNAGALRTTLVTGASPMTAPGIDPGGEAVLGAAVNDPRTLFRVTATPLVRVRDGRTGIFLVQSAPRLAGGVLQPGFVVLFVPGSWLFAEVTEETDPRLQLRIGETLYGDLGRGPAVGSAFSGAGRRFEVRVPREPVQGTAAALPWLVIGAGLVLAALVAALGAFAQRRGRAQREVDRIFMLSPDVITVAGFDGRWKRVNPAFEALLGFDEGEARGRPWVDFIHPDDLARTEAEAGRLVGGGTTFAFENRVLSKDGSYRWLAWTAISVPDEEVLYTMARDVTDRRRSDTQQAALRRIATLAAEGVEPEELFAVVAEEVARVVDVPLVRVMRYERDGTATQCASFSEEGLTAPFGSRSSLEGTSVLARVRETSRAARIDDYSGLDGELAEIARRSGISSGVGSPIVVAGRLWGAVVASSHEQLAEGTEQRLADFTDLLASAIGNAESREALERLADEQAALGRVATLVAREASPSDVFAAIAEEIGRLVGAEEITMCRYDGGAAVVVGRRGDLAAIPVGFRFPQAGGNLVSRVFETRRVARTDDYRELTGPGADVVRSIGIRSAVAVPVLVEGRLWGAIVAGKREEEPLPPETESRLGQFTELMATAVANAAARAEVERLAGEQASLRRVATRVAEGLTGPELFDDVAREVARVFGIPNVTIDRYDGDGYSTVVASVDDPGFSVGSRWPLDGPSLGSRVFETARPARIDDYSGLDSASAAVMRETSRNSAVGVPIIVDGGVWGSICVGTTSGTPLPQGIEGRIGDFTELVSTAIARAESREALARVADEQAALRRVATLVARGTGPEAFFRAVAEEVDALFLAGSAVIRFEDDGRVTVMGATAGPHAPGMRLELDQDFVVASVHETRRAARFDTDDPTAAGMPEIVRTNGIRSALANPIVVDGELWGAIVVASPDRPLEAATERRLAHFTELVATAIANTHARAQVTALAEEQAALRRIAVLVAQQPSPDEVFKAVTEAVGPLLGADLAGMLVSTGDGTATTIAGWSAAGPMLPIGTQVPLDGESAVARIFRTGAPARIEGYRDHDSATAELVRNLGVRSTVGAPIVVEGRLWGALMAATRGEKPLPDDAAARIAAFTELVATAISNAEAREQVERLAEEQAALRRVATLVAQGVQPAEIFSAVSEEVGRLLPAANVSMGRYESDDIVTSMASWSSAGPVFPPGVRWQIKGTNVAWMVLQTGRSARIDDFSAATDPIGVAVREAGYKSAIGSPIVVEGHLWGVISAASSEGPLPAGTETRLASFTELVATAIANAESKSELTASRRRIVAASDEARRRIERDLHDGTQQRLASLRLAVGSAEIEVPAELVELRAELSRIANGLADAVTELQEISRGIHPQILSAGGLGPALRTLARRSAIPVELDVRSGGRLPEPIEVAAYYVASEALANATKHAQASRIDVSLATRNGSLALSIRDDGVGGADPARGSGLLGLTDRVEALGGTISVKSARGSGTSILVTLPLDVEPTPG